MDKIPAEALEPVRAMYQALAPDFPSLAFSAATRQGLDELKTTLISHLPVRPPEYPEEQITDLYEREIAIELIREAALVFLQQEVPHALAVRLDEFSERENGNAYIAATLLVERDSQKGIVIGEGGAMLRKIGSAARKEIEAMSDRKVFLELRVKVEKDWRDNEEALRRLGYKIRKK
jgi:GTP-binding protein Era